METAPTVKKFTNTQKEVWENVKTYTDLIIKGKTSEFLKYFHNDYSGWTNSETEPIGIEDIAEELDYSLPKHKNVFYKIKPAAIKIHYDVAIVHYYFSSFVQSNSKNEEVKARHFTDILMKKNDKWVLIGDHAETRKVVG